MHNTDQPNAQRNPRVVKAKFNFGKSSQTMQQATQPTKPTQPSTANQFVAKPALTSSTTPREPRKSNYEKLTNTWITALAGELTSQYDELGDGATYPPQLHDFASALTTEIATGIRWQSTLCAMQANQSEHIDPDNIELLTCRLTGSPIGVIDATTTSNGSGLTPQLTVMCKRSLSAIRDHQPVAYLNYILSTFWIVDPATGNAARGYTKQLDSYALIEADRVSSLKTAYSHILSIMSNVDPSLAYAITRVADVVLSSYMTRNRADTLTHTVRIRAAQLAHDWLDSTADVTTNPQATRDFIKFITNLSYLLAGSHERLASAVITAQARSRNALIGAASYAPSSHDWSAGFASANSASVKDTRNSAQRERAAIERQQAVLELRLKPQAATCGQAGQPRSRKVSQRTLDAEAAATDIFSDISITLEGEG